MINFDKLEILNLYLFFLDLENIPEPFNVILNKLEKEIYNTYSVLEIENYRKIFKDKGTI
ncbi:MAG: hypothetical protein JXR64_05090 [Spirochaetales bacterium]|nr:hypothetical protein [Spirochaetales bacterium]